VSPVRVGAAIITVNLAAAGLTHAQGRSDRCQGGLHDIDMDAAVTDTSESGLVDPAGLTGALQTLHRAAHPDGTASWEFCREPGCTELAEFLT
jgi:hypothetical protein